MITIDNYFNEIRSIDLSHFPEALQKSHEFVLKITNEGNSWTNYHSSDAIQKTVDIYLTKLNEAISSGKKSAGKKEKKQTEREHKTKPQKADKPEKQTAPAIPVTLVERISEELRFLRRFVNLDGKTKTKDELLRFINSLQKAILEKRIRKTSTWANQIVYIQENLIQVYNSMKQKIKIELKPETKEQFIQIVGDEKVRSSINFIKRYISLNGKTGVKEKARKLLTQIDRAIEKEKIPSYDRYISQIKTIMKNLNSFIGNKGEKTLEIEQAELNGLQGILG